MPPQQLEKASTPVVGETYNDLIAAMQATQERQEEILKEQIQQTKRSQEDYKRDREQFEGIFEGLVDKLEQVDQDLEQMESRFDELQQRDGSGGLDPNTNVAVSEPGHIR